MATEYFVNIFNRDDSVQPGNIVELFEECITPEMNLDFSKPYSEEEIGNALFQIGPLKAPGPDGFPGRSSSETGCCSKKI